MNKHVSEFVRLRVDPSKIRISVRYYPYQGYKLKATNLHNGNVFAILFNDSVSVGMFDLLDALNARHVDGLNIDLMNTYKHPQYKNVS